MPSRRTVPTVFFVESPGFRATGETARTADGPDAVSGLDGVSDSPPQSAEASAAGGKSVVGSAAGGSPSP